MPPMSLIDLLQMQGQIPNNQGPPMQMQPVGTPIMGQQAPMANPDEQRYSDLIQQFLQPQPAPVAQPAPFTTGTLFQNLFAGLGDALGARASVLGRIPQPDFTGQLHDRREGRRQEEQQRLDRDTGLAREGQRTAAMIELEDIRGRRGEARADTRESARDAKSLEREMARDARELEQRQAEIQGRQAFEEKMFNLQAEQQLEIQRRDQAGMNGKGFEKEQREKQEAFREFIMAEMNNPEPTGEGFDAKRARYMTMMRVSGLSGPWMQEMLDLVDDVVKAEHHIERPGKEAEPKGKRGGKSGTRDLGRPGAPRRSRRGDESEMRSRAI